VYDPGVAQQVDALISAQQGRRISAAQLNARSFPVRIRDAAARLMLPYL
jgi:cardiolipin synthase A/B